MDKAELCGSLLTWVGWGRGQGQVCAHSFSPRSPGLGSVHFSVLGLGGGRGSLAGGAVGLWPEHPPPSRGRPVWKEQVKPRPFVAGSRGARAQVSWPVDARPLGTR